MIIASKHYSVNDIAKENLVAFGGESFNAQKQMILRYIREGRLEATNVGGEKKPRYIVSGAELLKFIHMYGKQTRFTKK